MNGIKEDLIKLSDEVWERNRARLAGLTDDEYLWEPTPGCWSLSERRDGTFRIDWPLPRPEPEPFTTIAWRLWHLIDMYGEDRAPRWLDLPPQGDAVGMDAADATPPRTAADALDMLDRAHARWDAHLHLVTDESLTALVGPVGGNYADRTRRKYVLHMLHEYIHHGAEIAMLRDLWRWQHPLDTDALTERSMRGDASLLDDLRDIDAATQSGLLDVAARYGRWELVARLVEAGSPISTAGRTPLHMAAGAGERAVVELLVAHGASLTALDDEFHATPSQWASFLGHPEVGAWLDTLHG